MFPPDAYWSSAAPKGSELHTGAPTELVRRNLAWRLDRRRFLMKIIPRGSVGAEIGVWKGDFARLLLRGVRPTRLDLIDPWLHVGDPPYSESWYGMADQEEMDTIYESVVATLGRRPVVRIHRASSLAAAPSFEDACFDWVYLDADHTYGAVLADLSTWARKIKPGGLLICDDYIEGGWFQGGVKRAVDEYVDGSNLQVEIRAHQAIFRL